MHLLYDRPARLVSLNLEQIAADNSSEVTGRTSGYSTSNDSDLEESRELDFDIEDEMPLSRETQVRRRACWDSVELVEGRKEVLGCE